MFNLINVQALESSYKQTVKFKQKLFPTEDLKYRT